MGMALVTVLITEPHDWHLALGTDTTSILQCTASHVKQRALQYSWKYLFWEQLWVFCVRLCTSLDFFFRS